MEFLLPVFILGIIIFIRKIIVDKIGLQKYQTIFLNLFTIGLAIFFIINPHIPLSLFEEDLTTIIGVLSIFAFLIFLDVFCIYLWIKGKFDD